MATSADAGESAILVPIDVPVAVRRLRDRLDPSAALGVPVHVTLIYPFMAPNRLDDAVRQRIERIVRQRASFSFALREVARWPEVVYLKPEPAEPFAVLTDALAREFPDFPPYGGEHEVVVPHVTIAHDPRPDYLAAAEHALPPMLPLRAVAREAWVMARPPGEPWRTVWQLPFGRAGSR